FFKSHRRDDSGVELGSSPLEHQHHHLPHQHHHLPQDHHHLPHQHHHLPHQHHYLPLEYHNLPLEYHQHRRHTLCYQHAIDLDCGKRRSSEECSQSEGSECEVERGRELESPRYHDDNISVQSEMMLEAPPEGVEGEEAAEPGGRRFRRSRNHQFRIGRRFSSQKMVRKMKKAVHFGRKSAEDDIDIEVHPTKLSATPQQQQQ
ncbi:hypothetical protein OTU49_015329, partial [Cherax quadricarinatus]